MGDVPHLDFDYVDDAGTLQHAGWMCEWCEARQCTSTYRALKRARVIKRGHNDKRTIRRDLDQAIKAGIAAYEADGLTRRQRIDAACTLESLFLDRDLRSERERLAGLPLLNKVRTRLAEMRDEEKAIYEQIKASGAIARHYSLPEDKELSRLHMKMITEIAKLEKKLNAAADPKNMKARQRRKRGEALQKEIDEARERGVTIMSASNFRSMYHEA
jgi:hypothetical protein